MGENKKSSDVWCRLIIPYSEKTEEDQIKIKKAIDLLREAGIDFDSGTDGNSLDIELDWSLRNAYLQKVDMACCNCKSKDKELKTYNILLHGKMWENYIFCNKLCANEYQEKIRKEKQEK